MCGIAGIINLNKEPINKEKLKNMVKVIKYRGPDDEGYYIDNNIGLGHCRLSIIDLSSAGHQPMSNKDKSLWIVYNGEIYNYIELRNELKKQGYTFRSNSDTEVIIHAYEEWGENCVKKFNGMWAFALWDQHKKQLFCSRDRFGIKPLYYYFDKKTFIFASEIKAILKALNQKPEPNWPVVYNYLMNSILCYSEETFFKHIQRLNSAHSLIVSPQGLRKYKYWDYQNYNIKNYNDTTPEKTFYDLFYDAVKIRTRSDVPVALTLSGGLDSSSIAAFFAKIKKDQHIKSFSAIFPGFKDDESYYAKLVADRFSTEPHYIQPRAKNLIGTLKKIISHMDYPSHSTAVFPVYEIMKKVHQENIKVVLEGQGADELLAGYVNRNLAPYIIDELNTCFRSPSKTKQFIREIIKIKQLYGAMPFLWVMRNAIPQSHQMYQKLMGISNVLDKDFKKTYGKTEKLEIKKKFPDRLTNELYYCHWRDSLPPLLKYGDALSMAFSVESRLPFMDYRLIEFVFALPYAQKINNATTKYILRNAFKNILPKEILNRNKVGFSNPIAKWLRGAMNTEIKPILLSNKSRSRHIYNTKVLAKMLDKHESGKVDLNHYIFRWLSLELWLEQFID